MDIKQLEDIDGSMFLNKKEVSKIRIWLYGKVMSGKTTFASQFEGAKIISTDGNASYTFNEEDIFRVRNYDELDEAIKKLKTIKPSWVIVDTTSYLIDFIRLDWLTKNKVDHESELLHLHPCCSSLFHEN